MGRGIFLQGLQALGPVAFCRSTDLVKVYESVETVSCRLPGRCHGHEIVLIKLSFVLVAAASLGDVIDKCRSLFLSQHLWHTMTLL